ncbi:uncharacterized protein JCM10292_002428 [Rhodotorula paludigena]|uniref:uncharacterized protein n=1 Tax=Rhodotorula paludigena TaxID=86838 RepID=UPI00316FD669
MPAAPPDAATTASIATSLTSEILHELVLDVAIEEHRLAGLRRSRAAAARAAGLNGLTDVHLGAPVVLNGSGAGPSPTKKDEGLFECLVCQRQIAAPRYASHLSGCMGLTGSRRGAERRAAAANGKASGANSRTGSVASSHGSDTDSAKSNGIKHSATASPAGGQPKPKKPKPAPLAPAAPLGTPQFLPPHIGSHPLSKTMSLPSSPNSSPSALYPPIPNTAALPQAQLPANGLQAPPMQARASLPGSAAGLPPGYGLAAKSPGSKRPPHPLAHASTPPLQVPKQPTSQQQLHSDRPDSDSEDSDVEVQHAPAARPPLQAQQQQPGQKVPRRADGSTAGATNGAGAASSPGGPQKAPRKAMPAGRKGVAAAIDSGSESDVASDGSDSD